MNTEEHLEDGDPQDADVSRALRAVLASDASGIGACATVLASLLRHTKEPVEARIFSRDVEPVTVRSGRLMLEVMRVPEELQWLSQAAGTGNGGGCDWAAALVCCGDWNRALVLGIDQLVVGDAAGLLETEMGGTLVAALMESGGGSSGSGLPLVLDLAAMRDADLYGSILASLKSGVMAAWPAFRAACGKRVADIGWAVAEFPSARGMAPEVVVARFAGLFNSGSGGISGTALWRAHETDWPELTCGLWCPGVGKGKNGDMPQELLVELIRGTRGAGAGCQVLEIGGWDSSGMAAAASRWLDVKRDRWTVMFRTHADGLALEEAITRFGACLGECAPATEILDGIATEILAWLMTQEDRWEKVDAVILHPPGRAGDFLTEACMAWSLLRPGGAMVIQAGRERPPQEGVCPFAKALDGFVAAVSGGALDRDGAGWCVVRKGGAGWFAHGTAGAEGGTDQPAGGPWEGPAWQRLPDTRVEVAHPYWRDEVMLHHGGLFTRKTTSCGGRWIWNPVLRELTLAWKVHHPETFVVGADGTAAPAPPPSVPLVCHTPEKVVFVRPNGRTGNHLFQYAYGLHLARKFGCRLHGNLYLLAGMEGIPAEVTHGSPPPRTALLRDVDDTMAARCLADPGIDGLELDGFFQDYGHFEDIREQLLPILGAVEKREAIGVHVRRGDYVGSGYEMGLTPAYFVSGVRQIIEDYPADYREILVFSDDLAWCEENLLRELGRILPTTVFDGAVNESLCAMKSMRAMVIPNSTFSWWGAWLADAPVVFPSAWAIANGGYQAGLGCTRWNWQVNRRFLGASHSGEPMATGHPKVLFLVKSAAGNHERRVAQEERWLKNLPAEAMYFFCVGGHEGASPRVDGHHLLLPCPDDYDHLPAKLKRMVAWVAWESEWTWFDYVVILDDDVVADIGRLYDFLRQDPDHFGHRLNGDPAHILGMFTGYSMKAFRILAGVIGELPDDGIDDLLVGRAVWEPFAGLNVMTDGERIKAFGAEASEATFAMEIRPFSAAAMRVFSFPPPPIRRRVSFCLFGDNPQYWRGAITNADLVRMHYPGWEAVFHTKDVPPGVLSELRNRGATVVECDYANMMFARFLPFCEEGVVISRDCDSRIDPREVRAVNEWLASDEPYHVIRDHPEHIVVCSPVLGGLWGGRKPLDENTTLSLEKALNDPRYAGWGGDQRWLAEEVWNPDEFFVHQYDQVSWMKDGWDPGHFCGMRHGVPPEAESLKEVVLWEGFFNRLNGLVNGLLIHGSSFRARWAVNAHLPHRFEDLFEPIPGIEVVNEPDLTYWPQNTNPSKGPLCHWFVCKNCGADLEEIAGAYRHLISRLKVGRSTPPSALGIHFRGLHQAASVSPGDFARWCLEQARARGTDQCFGIADSGREEIEAILAQGGIRVIWGRSAPLKQDLDRNALGDVMDFIGDVLTLADCDTALTSFDETTIVDPARGFGREVIAFTGTREWSECWFYHHGWQSQRVRAAPASVRSAELPPGRLRILIADVLLAGKPHADWKEGYELCYAFRNLGHDCDVAGPNGSIPETMIAEIADDYDLVIITENYPAASGWKWWDWAAIKTPKLFWAIDTHLVDYLPWIRSADINMVAFNNPQDMERYGLDNSFFMPYGVSRRNFLTQEIVPVVRDIVFIGGMLPERRRICEKFGIVCLNAYGPDYVREMQASKICLNQSMSHDINSKYFDIPASGSFMLANYNEHFHRCMDFRADIGKMLYRTEDELGEKIGYYRVHEEERLALAKSARDHIFAKHCWENRAERILEQFGRMRNHAGSAGRIECPPQEARGTETTGRTNWETGQRCDPSEFFLDVFRTLVELREKMRGRDDWFYGTHLEALCDVLRVITPDSNDTILEFGGGHFSTPLLLASGAKVHTVEQGDTVPDDVNHRWAMDLRRTYAHYPNWTLGEHPGPDEWRHVNYPADVAFCFVDGHPACRKEVIDAMLVRGVPVVAAHDSELSCYRYDLVEDQPGYAVFDFRGLGKWTRIWTKHRELTRFLEENPLYHRVGRVVRTDVYGTLLQYLDNLRVNDHAAYLYGTHLEALRNILSVLAPPPGEVLMEIGGGHFSTPLLLASGARVFTLEQGQNVPEEVNREWLRQLQEAYGGRRNWHLMDLPGTTAWRNAIYPPGVLFCFVDGNGNCRKEMVEFMLQREVPVVAAHDSETASYRYAQITAPPGYSVHDFRGREVWTRIWSKHQELTRVLDESQLYYPVGGSPPVIDLRAIPVCLIGVDTGRPQDQQHRYWNRQEYAGSLFPHTFGVPSMPGGHAFGCSAAHLEAVKLAISANPGEPVLLLEDDAVQTVWFQPMLGQIPPDADIIWLGCSNGIYDGRPSPDFIPSSNGKYHRLRGVCQASHAILLVTDSGKMAWRTCCERAVAGEMGASTDLVCSIVGVTLCRQYVLTKPAFFQPDYYATLIPLVPDAIRP